MGLSLGAFMHWLQQQPRNWVTQRAHDLHMREEIAISPHCVQINEAHCHDKQTKLIFPITASNETNFTYSYNFLRVQNIFINDSFDYTST